MQPGHGGAELEQVGDLPVEVGEPAAEQAAWWLRRGLVLRLGALLLC
ncbi:hypothetical protein SAMN05661080_04436 [Modestobacter sp. DSM 44400]|nr:hypothetical protein SAMN05661080_04436 [Modestobacter sp. DSM 44400]